MNFDLDDPDPIRRAAAESAWIVWRATWRQRHDAITFRRGMIEEGRKANGAKITTADAVAAEIKAEHATEIERLSEAGRPRWGLIRLADEAVARNRKKAGKSHATALAVKKARLRAKRPGKNYKR